MPRDMQKVFMVASCLGSNFTERLVEIALQEPVEDRFKLIMSRGKLEYNEDAKTYSFKHNVFQEACYGLLSEDIRPAYHLEIGLRLW
jgi:predicted ATPase